MLTVKKKKEIYEQEKIKRKKEKKWFYKDQLRACNVPTHGEEKHIICALRNLKYISQSRICWKFCKQEKNAQNPMGIACTSCKKLALKIHLL